MSTSLALSWLPKGARGWDDADPEAVRILCGGSFGDGAVSCAARFFNSASNCPGSYFLASAFASARAICCGFSGVASGASTFSTGFGGGGGGAGLGSGSGGGGGGGAGFCSGGVGAGGIGGAAAAEGGGAG
jgi:hypothetical protein